MDEVIEAKVLVDTLDISGVSAGTMANLNHFDIIEHVAQVAKVKSLCIVMDSSLGTDRLDTNFSSLFKVVDPIAHPLCFK